MARKTERHLIFCLLASRRFLTRETIRASVENQGLSDAAFQRMFERDKDDLRDLGIPIEWLQRGALQRRAGLSHQPGDCHRSSSTTRAGRAGRRGPC